jgi:hypothetical protein
MVTAVQLVGWLEGFNWWGCGCTPPGRAEQISVGQAIVAMKAMQVVAPSGGTGLQLGSAVKRETAVTAGIL